MPARAECADWATFHARKLSLDIGEVQLATSCMFSRCNPGFIVVSGDSEVQPSMIWEFSERLSFKVLLGFELGRLSYVFIAQKPAMALPCFLLWLASMHSVRYKGHRIEISREAELQEDDPERERPDDEHGAQILGIFRVKKVQVYDAMMLMSPELKQQLEFWQSITGKNLHGNAYIFVVDKTLQQLGTRHFRGFLSVLEPEQPPRLWRDLDRAANHWQGDMPPDVMLRAPKLFVEQVACGRWPALLLPHIPNTKKSGSSTLTMNWPAVGIDAHHPSIPQLSLIAQTFPDEESSVVLSAELLDEAMEFLRTYAASLSVHATNETFEDVEYISLQKCVATFQALKASMDPSAFVRSVRDMTGKGVALWRCSRRPYQLAFLVKAVTLASLLRSADAMSEALQTAACIVLPSVLQPSFLTMVETCRQHIPHESTISRWKLLLDGSFMLFQRQCNQAQSCASGGFVRYLMADASSQHGRELEHIMICSIKKQDLARLYASYFRLMDMWPLG